MSLARSRATVGSLFDRGVKVLALFDGTHAFSGAKAGSCEENENFRRQKCRSSGGKGIKSHTGQDKADTSSAANRKGGGYPEENPSPTSPVREKLCIS